MHSTSTLGQIRATRHESPIPSICWWSFGWDKAQMTARMKYCTSHFFQDHPPPKEAWTWTDAKLNSMNMQLIVYCDRDGHIKPRYYLLNYCRWPANAWFQRLSSMLSNAHQVQTTLWPQHPKVSHHCWLESGARTGMLIKCPFLLVKIQPRFPTNPRICWSKPHPCWNESYWIRFVIILPTRLLRPEVPDELGLGGHRLE